MSGVRRAFCTSAEGPLGVASTPIGHTRFSWQARPLERPDGHTAYSWLHAAVLPEAGASSEARVASAELRAALVRSNMRDEDMPAGAAHVRAAAERERLTGVVLWRAPSTYYSWKLEERA